MEETLRNLQLTQLEILAHFDHICRTHGLRYSLYAGSLLGAVRHQGFIPWDDDLDVCMPREDYERFLTLWSDVKPQGYFLQNKDTDPGFTQSFSKIRKDHTTFIQYPWEEKRYHNGIFLDIFPIDRIPAGKLAKMLFFWDCMRYQLLTREFVPPKASLPVRLGSKLILACCQKAKRPKARAKLLARITRYSRDPSLQTVGIETLETLRCPFPADLTDDYTTLSFEGRCFPCFAHWDAYLTCKYGDYRVLPPKSEQIWKHHPIVLDFSRNREEIPQPIRILHVIGRMDRGGAENTIMNLYRSMDRSRVQFDFVQHTEKPAAFDEEIRALGGRIFRCPRYRGYNHLAYTRWWHRFFPDHPGCYPIVHGHIGSTAAIYLSIAKGYGVHTIAHSHSAGAGSLLYRLFAYPTRYVADQFFACSRDAGIARYGKQVGSSRCTVLPNAIDAARFAYRPEVAQKMRQELHIEEDTLVVGHVGRFVKEKNHRFLLEIFAQIQKHRPDAHLLLVGDGPLRSEMEQLTAGQNLQSHVIFAGLREDVWNYYQAMDVFLFPSLFEGLPLSLVEAQTAGLPCCISDVVPKDVDLTELVHRISLNKPAEVWATTALQAVASPRKDRQAEIRSSGFDVASAGQMLMDTYCKVVSSHEP